MTALLELKQKIKEFYSEHDVLLLSVGKFLLAFLLFQGINSSMGMMEKIDNIFVVLILAIVCAILPVNTMAVIGCLLIVAHCYAVGIEVAGFALVFLILLIILFLRFTAQDNAALVFTPVAFTFKIPAVVPVLGGLLRTPACAVPASCGVLLYHESCERKKHGFTGKRDRACSEIANSSGRHYEESGNVADNSGICGSNGNCIYDFQMLL